MERGKSFIGEMFNFVKTFTPEQKKLSIMVAILHLGVWSLVAQDTSTMIIVSAFGWLFYHALNTYQMLKYNKHSNIGMVILDCNLVCSKKNFQKRIFDEQGKVI